MIDKNITLNMIGGYEAEKEEVEKIINFFKNYDEYIRNGAKLPRGILFYGGPGNGKTMFATAIANESKAKLYSLTSSEFDNEENFNVSVHKIFNEAKKNSPSIILIDELDQLVVDEMRSISRATDKQREMLRILLTEIDALNNSGVLIIATSNSDIHMLPTALMRAGRIEKHIIVSHPNIQEREAILDIYLKQNNIFKNIKSSEIARITNGLNGSSLVSIVNDVLIKCLSSCHKEAVYNDFYGPIQSVISNGIKRKPRIDISHIAYHEIGHLITVYALTNKIGSINIENYGTSGGRCYIEDEDETNLLTFNDYLKEASICLSGLAATEVFLGARYNGAEDDIRKAIMLFNEASKNGLGDIGLVFSAQLYSDTMDASERYKETAAKFIEDAYIQAKTIIELNKNVVSELFSILRKERFMTSGEVKKILKKYRINREIKLSNGENDDINYLFYKLIDYIKDREYIDYKMVSEELNISYSKSKTILNKLFEEKVITVCSDEYGWKINRDYFKNRAKVSKILGKYINKLNTMDSPLNCISFKQD